MPHGKPGIPSSAGTLRKNLPPAKFNLGAMVNKTVFALYVKGICQQKNMRSFVDFFDGLLAGYNDWYETLGINQDIFDTIQDKLDKEDIMKKAQNFVNDAIKKDSRKIITPSESGYRVAKEMFDQKLMKAGGLEIK